MTDRDESLLANQPLNIGELAQAAGASAKTIRYYEQIGLLPPPQRADNGYRLYGNQDVERLRFIRNARSLGFSLDDLKEVLALRDQGEAPCRYVAHLLGEKAAEVEERIRRLRDLQQELQQLVEQADRLPDDIEMKQCVCHLIYERERAIEKGKRFMKNVLITSPLACDLSAIEPDQRARHQANTRQLFAAVQERQELPDGYAFRFTAEPALIPRLAEFISLERLCCPFLNFVLIVEPEHEPIWLKLTGRDGVKQFLLAELGLE